MSLNKILSPILYSSAEKYLDKDIIILLSSPVVFIELHFKKFDKLYNSLPSGVDKIILILVYLHQKVN